MGKARLKKVMMYAVEFLQDDILKPHSYSSDPVPRLT